MNAESRAPLRVLFLGYSWTPDFKPDAYQLAVMDAFSKQGAQVKFALANYMVERIPLVGIHPAVSEAKLFELFRTFAPDLVISMNGGGLTREMRARISCPVVTWIVDDLSHLFAPDVGAGGGHQDFGVWATARDPLVVSSHETYRNLRKMLGPSANLVFVSSCTDFAAFRAVPAAKQDIPISFVGSYLDYSPIEKLFAVPGTGTKESDLAAFVKLEAWLRENFRGDFGAKVAELGLRPLLQRNGIDDESFKVRVANLISSRARLSAVLELAPLGIQVFGNSDWIKALLAASPTALSVYQVSQAVRSHAELVRVYQRSRLSLNVIQLQTGPALSYRVFDILASDSLLLHPHHPESDAFEIFGRDNPIVTYRSLAELREKAEYYLKHEDARREKVAACQALVRERFSFAERVRDLLAIAKVHPLPEIATRVEVEWLARDHFHRPLFKLKGRVRELVIGTFRNTLQKVLRPRGVNALIRLIGGPGARA